MSGSICNDSCVHPPGWINHPKPGEPIPEGGARDRCGVRYSYNNGSANAMDGHHNIIDRCGLKAGHAGDHGRAAPPQGETPPLCKRCGGLGAISYDTAGETAQMCPDCDGVQRAHPYDVYGPGGETPSPERGRAEAWECKARASATDPPTDCDWPMCGCDPLANKVLEALDEAGLGVANAMWIKHAREAQDVFQHALNTHNSANPWLGICAAAALLLPEKFGNPRPAEPPEGQAAGRPDIIAALRVVMDASSIQDAAEFSRSWSPAEREAWDVLRAAAQPAEQDGPMPPEDHTHLAPPPPPDLKRLAICLKAKAIPPPATTPICPTCKRSDKVVIQAVCERCGTRYDWSDDPDGSTGEAK